MKRSTTAAVFAVLSLSFCAQLALAQAEPSYYVGYYPSPAAFFGTASAGNAIMTTSRVNGTLSAKCLKTINGAFQAGDCASDERFKKDIIPLPYALNKILGLRPVQFKWRTDQFPQRRFSKGTTVGLIAQDVEKVMPELVGQDTEGYKTVRYGSQLQLLTIQAIKELREQDQKILQAQQKKIAELEAQLQDLKSQLKSIPR